MTSTAQRLIEKNGRRVSIIRMSGDDTDSETPWRRTAGLEDGFEVTAVFVGTGGFDIRGDQSTYVDNRNMNTKALTCWIAEDSAPGVDYSLYQFLEDADGVRYKIVSSSVLKPGNSPIVHFLELQR